MPDWLEEYGQRLDNRRSHFLSGCSGVPVFPYIYKYKDIDKISNGQPGTPAFGSGVPGVPEEGAREHREHGNTRGVFHSFNNIFSAITPGTPRTPPGDRVQIARATAALPEPTLPVLARLQEHFTAKGRQGWEADTLALATLGELMRRKGGPVAMAKEIEAVDELSKAIRVVKEVFGPEVERKQG